MLSVRIELLASRYRAANFEDRRRPEWPPHPARLFYAAVAAVYDTDEPDSDETDLLVWLEGLGAPDIASSPNKVLENGTVAAGWTERIVVDHYVPGNYATSWTTRSIDSQWQELRELQEIFETARASGVASNIAKADRAFAKANEKMLAATSKITRPTGSESSSQIDTAVQLLPDLRNRQARHFPVVTPDCNVIHFSWPNAKPSAEQGKRLDAILSRVPRLGHSATPVSCSVTDSAGTVNWVPSESGGAKSLELRTVASGVLGELLTEFERHQGISARVLPAVMTRYAEPRLARRSATRPVNVADWIVLPLNKDQKLPIHRGLDVARSVRGALLHHATDPVSTFISGHQPGTGATPPTTQAHLAILCLPHATSIHADGLIHGVALGLPAETTQTDRAAVEQAVKTWASQNDPAGPVVTLPGGLLRQFGMPRGMSFDDRPRRRIGSVTDYGYWSQVSDEWASVTPVALDRYPKTKPGNSEARDEEILDILGRSCENVGLPRPVEVAANLNSIWAAAPPVTAGRQALGNTGQRRFFRQFQTNASSQPRFTTHLRIRFAEPVGGPIVLGAGRFYGYGLLYPVPSTSTTP